MDISHSAVVMWSPSLPQESTTPKIFLIGNTLIIWLLLHAKLTGWEYVRSIQKLWAQLTEFLTVDKVFVSKLSATESPQYRQLLISNYMGIATSFNQWLRNWRAFYKHRRVSSTYSTVNRVTKQLKSNEMYILLPLLTLATFMTCTVFYYQEQQLIAYVDDWHLPSSPVEPLILPSVNRMENVGNPTVLAGNTTLEDVRCKLTAIFLASARVNSSKFQSVPMGPLSLSAMNPVPASVNSLVRARQPACKYIYWVK